MLEAVNAGKFNDFHLERIVTRRIPLEDYVQKGINALTHEKDTHGESKTFCTGVACSDIVYSQNSRQSSGGCG